MVTLDEDIALAVAASAAATKVEARMFTYDFRGVSIRIMAEHRLGETCRYIDAIEELLVEAAMYVDSWLGLR